MKKITTTLLTFLVCLTLAGFSQNWNVMTLPEVEGNYTLQGIHFTNADHGWAAGFIYKTGFFDVDVEGLILEFKNGAWIKADYPSPAEKWNLHGIWFVNNQTGWAFGQNVSAGSGVLMQYKSGSWEIINLSIVPFKEWVLYDVYFPHENEGYAVGSSWGDDKPVFLHFKDGKWSTLDVAEFKKQTLLAIHGTSPDHIVTGGFREGEFGRTGISRALGSYIISKTKTSWEQAKLPLLSKNIICRDIVCLSEKNVITVGWMPAFQNAPETGKILQFNGSKWSEMDISVDAKQWDLKAVAFESADKGWAIGNYPARNKGLFVEYNKGKWTTLGKKAEPEVSDNWRLNGACYDGNETYYAVGADEKSNKGIILKLNR